MRPENCTFASPRLGVIPLRSSHHSTSRGPPRCPPTLRRGRVIGTTHRGAASGPHPRPARCDLPMRFPAFSRQPIALTILLALLAVGSAMTAAPADDTEVLPPVDYTTDVKPILQRHCYDCHSASAQEAGLRVDTAVLAIEGGDSGAGIVPGKSAESRLLAVVTGESEDVARMPLDADPLTAEEIDILRRWIDAGAPHPGDEVAERAHKYDTSHWAFQPVERPSVPRFDASGDIHNAIDAFIHKRLMEAGVKPSDEADRVTLIRRLYLDLLGVLPSPAEVDDFLADDQPAAYERLVDRVLASPRYGERWGRHWLDAARYADSNGFTIDGERTMWPYRDWVIAALNADMPFDQFTIEQLAGDMLPDPTTEQLVATGFHRNTLANQEGGTDDEQFRVESVVDRVNTTGAVWMGVTIGCAQCHEHKFDPFSQRDYYRLYAVFNSTADNNDAGGLAPKIDLPTPDQAARRKQIKDAIAQLKQQRTDREQELAQSQADWEQNAQSAAASGWHVIEPIGVVSTGGADITRQEDASWLVSGAIPGHDVYEIRFPPPEEPVTALRLEVLPHASLPKGGPGLAGNGNFVLTGFELAIENPSTETTEEAPTPISIQEAFADHSQPNYPVAHAIDDDPMTGWAINGAPDGLNVRRVATFVLDAPPESAAGQTWIIRLRHESAANTSYQIGCFRLSRTQAPSDAIRLPEHLLAALAVPAEERSKEQQEQITQAFRKADESWRELTAQIDAQQQKLNSLNGTIPTTLVMQELDEPRETFVQIRGNFLELGARVEPGVPEVLPDVPAEEGTITRLDLAQWLVSPQHPLTARVTVNRIWQRFFGVGLVATENDFGTQGSPPTHPELLDWLASELIRRDWSLKSMHRLIVTSAAYRRSSHQRDDLAEVDPRNRLLARQSRVRLDAEVIRDACLSASGLLADAMGGPPVHPPQPEGIYLFTQSAKPWPESQGENRYRRGLYTQFWRSSPHPMMPTFDAPDANSTCTRRVRSNTPLQALTLANDRSFVELAQGFARRVLTEAEPYDEGRLRYAVRCALCREPQPAELTRLSEFLQRQQQAYAAHPELAKAAAPDGLPAGVSVESAAAWTALTRVLLNLDEFITRE
ncbi:MAG: DUF1553 domain-containing protein [Planctomycetota bacterium]|nr:MAG: DUF1553 domain-containing protein [Planctomycetota bacterium]